MSDAGGDTTATATNVLDPAKPVPAEYDVFCEACGYSLVGITADRCPECGTAYDPNDLPFARIPWLHRQRRGTLRAYLATVSMVMFRPRRFARELCRPVRVSGDDARRFRKLSLRIATVSFLLAVAGIVAIEASAFRPLLSTAILVRVLAVAAAYGVVAAVFFALATDMPLFIWKGLPSRPPNELAPVHRYASAPLALMPVFAVIAIAGTAVGRVVAINEIGFIAFMLLTGGVVAVLLILWVVSLVLMKTASGASARRMVALALYLPFHWVLATLVVSLGLILFMMIVDPLIRALTR